VKKIISLLAISSIVTNTTSKSKIKTTKPVTSFSEVSGIDDHQVKSKTKTIVSPRDLAYGKTTDKIKYKARKKLKITQLGDKVLHNFPDFYILKIIICTDLSSFFYLQRLLY
jgi:hypothetical protein